MKGHAGIVKELLDKGAAVDAVDKDGATALYVAARDGHLTIVKELLANGAKVNSKDNYGHTALIMASMKVYDIITGMTGGGPANSTQTIATYMYQQTFLYNHFGKGSAIAITMMVIMMIIIIPYMLFTVRKD
jgi:hypothetical protein